MKIFREGIGAGAEKQYSLLSPHWDRDKLPECYLYWNAFTRDRERLELAKRRGVPIISRVGGWHFGESAETTAWVLERSDAAIFVSKYTQQLARLHFGERVPRKQRVIVNSAETVEYQPLADPPYLLVRCGGLGWPIWKKHMLSRSLSVTAIRECLPRLKEVFGLTLKVVGRADGKLKEYCGSEDIEFLPYTDNKEDLHALGSGAVALVHLVIGDHSPNTVCEIIGEGRPAIVFDKGGAREVAGRAAITVSPGPGYEGGITSVWCPLNGKTYKPYVPGLIFAVKTAIENHGFWRKQARKRAGEISPEMVAKKYAEFLEETCG